MGNTSHGVYCTIHILRLYGGGRPRLDTRIFLTRVLHVVRFFYKEKKKINKGTTGELNSMMHQLIENAHEKIRQLSLWEKWIVHSTLLQYLCLYIFFLYGIGIHTFSIKYSQQPHSGKQ